MTVEDDREEPLEGRVGEPSEGPFEYRSRGHERPRSGRAIFSFLSRPRRLRWTHYSPFM